MKVLLIDGNCENQASTHLPPFTKNVEDGASHLYIEQVFAHTYLENVDRIELHTGQIMFGGGQGASGKYGETQLHALL